MYKVTTPAGTIEVETLIEAKEYKNLYGYPYVKVSNPEDYLCPNELDVDAFGNCYSDADPGL
ncbi:MAG TPA: hypothetical protein PLW78_13750 [bacterium]|jgi:hypothetical protein|nr:hypothetical protein [bacterium]